MKKLYFAMLLSMSVLAGKAQYTITAAASPVVGDTEYTWSADTAGVSTGSAGTGQTWNYTGIVISPTAAVNSNTIVAKTAAPNYTAFPSATVAQEDQGGNYSFYDYSSSAATIYGSSDGTVTIVYSNPETLYTIPFSYGSTSSDTYAGTFTTSSIPATITGTVNTTGSGTGTLNMPGGKSYTNVLKVKAALHQVISASAVGYTSTTDAISYVYISSVSKNAILTVNVSTTTVASGTNTNTSYDKSVNVNRNLQLTGIQDYAQDMNFSMYPNPAAAEVSLHFVLTQGENYEMTMYNAMGQSVRSHALGKLSPGIYNETIDLSGLSKGVYYVNLKGTHTSGVQKLIVQ